MSVSKTKSKGSCDNNGFQTLNIVNLKKYHGIETFIDIFNNEWIPISSLGVRARFIAKVPHPHSLGTPQSGAVPYKAPLAVLKQTLEQINLNSNSNGDTKITQVLQQVSNKNRKSITPITMDLKAINATQVPILKQWKANPVDECDWVDGELTSVDKEILNKNLINVYDVNDEHKGNHQMIATDNTHLEEPLCIEEFFDVCLKLKCTESDAAALASYISKNYIVKQTVLPHIHVVNNGKQMTAKTLILLVQIKPKPKDNTLAFTINSKSALLSHQVSMIMKIAVDVVAGHTEYDTLIELNRKANHHQTPEIYPQTLAVIEDRVILYCLSPFNMDSVHINGANQRLKASLTKELMIDICAQIVFEAAVVEAYDNAQMNPIINGDIKSANIFIKKSRDTSILAPNLMIHGFTVSIGDFGLSLKRDITDNTIGSPSFTPHEVSDPLKLSAWQFGMTLCELFTWGTDPFPINEMFDGDRVSVDEKRVSVDEKRAFLKSDVFDGVENEFIPFLMKVFQYDEAKRMDMNDFILDDIWYPKYSEKCINKIKNRKKNSIETMVELKHKLRIRELAMAKQQSENQIPSLQ
eukprot:443935_1